MGLNLTFFRVRHPVECNAVKVAYEGKTVVYSGDMNTTPGFEAFAENSDLLLIDGCFMEKDWNESKPHFSAFLAAGIGKRAGVKRLLITHVFPANDEGALLAEAKSAFPAAEVAQEGRAYKI